MKYLFVLVLLFSTTFCFAKKHKDDRGLPRTEMGLMNYTLGCLSNKDSANYFNLFPPFDTLWQLVMHNPTRSPEAVHQLNDLKEHPTALLEFDPRYNPAIMRRFTEILKKGEDSGIHWSEIVMQRYQLTQQVTVSRALSGYDVIAPERFQGYIFVRDLLGRLTFCISVTEIQKINGYFFGGQVLNILEAASVDQFLIKEAEERRYLELEAVNMKKDSARNDSVRNGLIDTTGQDSAKLAKKTDPLSVERPEEDTFKKRREVVDRKYYEGKFDEEIPVKLFVRYMRDIRTGIISGYDGLYKFGDQVQYAKLNITKNKDGVWTMDDDPPIGTMELELKNKVYTGSWTNNENQTGYDVVLTQKDLPSHKIEQLDRMLETNTLGHVDDDSKPPPPKPAQPEVEGMENISDDPPKPKAVEVITTPKDDDDDEKPAKSKKKNDDDE